MAGLGGVYRFLILVIAAFAVAGCSSPVGNIGGGINKSRSYDGLLVVSPVNFRVGDYLKKSDIAVYTITYDFERELVDPDAIKVIKDPGASTEKTDSVPPDYLFETKGAYDIMVEYKGLSVRYPIEVVDEPEITQTSNIIIKWLD